MLVQAPTKAAVPAASGDTVAKVPLVGASFLLVAGLALLTSSAFWAGVFFIAAGMLIAWSRAWWAVAVLAAFYPAHYQLVQDYVGDSGPFVMRNWMAAGFVCGLTIVGAGLLEGWRERPRDATERWYLLAVLGLAALSIVTFGPQSFQAEPSPFEYMRVWVVTAVASAALALMRCFPLRVFFWTSLALAFADLSLVVEYVDTGYGTNLSYVLSMGIFAALLLFSERIWVGIVLALPLVVGMALVPKQGPLLGTAVGLIVIWVGRASSSLGRRRRLATVGITMGAALLAVVATGRWTAIWRTLRETGMDVRLRLYEEVLQRFLASPLFGQWQVSPPVPRPAEFYANGLALPNYPHAAILEVVLSWGLVGLALWIFSQYLVVRPAWRVGLLGPWVAGVIFAQASGDLSGNYLYWFVGAIAIALTSKAAVDLRSPT